LASLLPIVDLPTQLTPVRKVRICFRRKVCAIKYGTALAFPDLIPRTLSDCLHELAYWCDLYWLRSAFDGYVDLMQESNARESFVFRCLTKIRPKSKEESVAVLRYLVDSERMQMNETNDILLNLIG